MKWDTTYDFDTVITPDMTEDQILMTFCKCREMAWLYMDFMKPDSGSNMAWDQQTKICNALDRYLKIASNFIQLRRCIIEEQPELKRHAITKALDEL